MDTKKIRPAESGNDAKREKVRVIPIQFFDDFPGHPFYVKMDEEMKALMESIKECLYVHIFRSPHLWRCLREFV